jgi:cyclophilin family peptidyl-prolyl cis-trans isomerase/HEAT repeat protein
MTRAAVVTALLVACLQREGGAAQRTRSTAPSPAPDASSAAFSSILAAEDSRLPLPDDLHTPGIDTLRAKQREDIRLLMELARSKDQETHVRAVRALGRLERRELIPELLPYLVTGSPVETANAIAQSFRGAPLPGDSGGQIDQAFEALTSVGAIPSDPRRGPGPVGAVGVAVGRLPYERAEQVRAAESYLLRTMKTVEVDDQLRAALPAVVRGTELLARLSGRLKPLDEETIDELRTIVIGRRHDYDARERVTAMEALLSARGVDTETLRAAATATSPPLNSPVLSELRRLAATTLGGAAATVVPTERADLLITLLADRFQAVRIEAVRAWARQESRDSGCQRLLDTLRDPSLSVVLAVIDALGDACRDDINVTDRLTAEARPPGPNEWHRASHALVALAKRSPGRAFISLLGGHVQHVTWQVRMYAARAAALVNEISALERLAYDANDNVREAALAPLRRLKQDEAEPYFVAALARDDYQLLRTAAIELKGARPTPQLANGLLDALRRVTAERKETSRDTRLAVLERLQELGGPDQAGALVPLLRDYDIRVAQLAAAVIQQWTGKPQEIDPQLLPRPALPTTADLPNDPARITLKSGKIFYIQLRTDLAPLTVTRFVRLARAGYYNGLTFHRVVPNFVIQGGSPHANEYAGDALYLRDEIGVASHVRGTVGLSTRGRDTGDAQLFINLVDNPRLDFDYTVLGTAGPMDERTDVISDIQEGDSIDSITFEKEEPSKAPAPSTMLAQCYAEGAFVTPDDHGCVVPIRPVHRRRHLVPPASRY